MDPTLFQRLNKNENDFVVFYEQLLLQKICFEVHNHRPVGSFLHLYFKMNDIDVGLLDEVISCVNQTKEKNLCENCPQLLSKTIQALISKKNQHYQEQVAQSLKNTITERQQNRAAKAIKKWNKKF
jgi:hypothetical protein